MREDDEFVAAFEACTLLPAQFTHAAHVRAAWWYLQHYPLGEAMDRFRTALRRFADSLGAEAPVNTYLGALEHNTSAVAEALAAGQ